MGIQIRKDKTLGCKKLLTILASPLYLKSPHERTHVLVVLVTGV